MPEPNLTERQQKWFATIRAGLERDTGKSMAEWIAIDRTCPEEGHRGGFAPLFVSSRHTEISARPLIRQPR
jgi:hypothetical protein